VSDELRALVAAFRERLAWHGRFGVTGAPLGRTPRSGVASPASSENPPGSSERGVEAATALRVIREDLGDCQRCKLAPGRKNIVFGVGKPDADLVFVGEAPGATEDARGEPFVGDAGQLLTKMIAAMGFAREDVYIANILKCRPPGNRDPEPDEVEACEPFLKRQLDTLRPKVIVALGRIAAQTLLRSDAPISALRGRWKSYHGIALLPTYHPAFLLRQPGQKRTAWEDLKEVLAELERQGMRPPRPPAG